MRLAALIVGVMLAAAAPAAAADVDVLVVGKTRVLKERTQALGGATVRGCRVAAGTPLAVLVRTRLTVRTRDYGSCGRSVRDAAGLFVTRVGADANRGRNGWVYKTGRRAGTRGAGDAGHRLRDGRRVLWFWCRMGLDGCQRTLVAQPSATAAAPGAQLRVTVRGYDDGGRGVAVAGATVTLAGASAVTGADGVATLTVPDAPGRRRLVAERAGMVRSFAEEVLVG